MASIHKLSASSRPLLEQCIKRSAPYKEDWGKRFAHLIKKNRQINIEIVKDAANSTPEEPTPVADPKSEELNDNPEFKNDAEIFVLMESDPITNLDNMIQECSRNRKLLSKIAEKLSTSALEKICNQMFSRTDLDIKFMSRFYEDFILECLTREYSWFSLDLLVKSYRFNKLKCYKLVKSLLKCEQVPIKLLEEFFKSLSAEEKQLFFHRIMDVQFTQQEFVLNLPLLLTAYKEVEINTSIQDFIFENILLHGTNCSTEKTFGKLLLLFLQKQNNIGFIKDKDKIERLVEHHATPFKRPCLNSFNENIRKYSCMS